MTLRLKIPHFCCDMHRVVDGNNRFVLIMIHEVKLVVTVPVDAGTRRGAKPPAMSASGPERFLLRVHQHACGVRFTGFRTCHGRTV